MSPEEVQKYLEDQAKLVIDTIENTLNKVMDDHFEYCKSNSPLQCAEKVGVGISLLFQQMIAQEMTDRSKSLSADIAKMEQTLRTRINLN